MRKWNRLGFLVASTAALASLAGIFITGCGSGSDTDTDTPFQGSYGGVWTVNRQVQVIDPEDLIPVALEPNFSGFVSITIDIKGRMVGSIQAAGGPIYTIDGDADEHGRMKGRIKTTSGDSFSFSGIFTEQNIGLFEDSGTYVAQSSLTGIVNTNLGNALFRPGLGGDFKLTINGVQQSGTLAVQGGQD